MACEPFRILLVFPFASSVQRGPEAPEHQSQTTGEAVPSENKAVCGKCFWLLDTTDLVVLIKFKNYINEFHKNVKINLGIVNNVTYKHANLQYETLCIVGYIKMTKSNKI
jgi:hypothetical protein